MNDEKKTKVLTAADFGSGLSSEAHKASEKPEQPENKKEKAEARKRNVHGRDTFLTRGYGVYPNRKYRRSFMSKHPHLRTQIEIEDKVTPFQKWLKNINDNIDNGELQHDSYVNIISQDQIAMEQSKDDHVRNSLLKFYGKNSKMAVEVFRNNKRLQSIREDKKIVM